MRCARLVAITGRKNRHLGTIAQLCRAISSQLRHVSTIRKKNLLSSNISSTWLHNMVNFSPLAAEICWRVWDTPAHFNGFRTCLGSVTARHSSSGRQPNFAVVEWCPDGDFLWSPYVIGQTIIFSSCSFFLSSIFYLSFFSRLISAAAHWISTILPHMVWP